MDLTHRILWGLLTFAIGSMATWLYKDKSSISRSEMREEIAAHYRACMEAQKAALREQSKVEQMRNGRIERLESCAATRADIEAIRNELRDFKDQVRNDLAELKDWMKTLHGKEP